METDTYLCVVTMASSGCNLGNPCMYRWLMAVSALASLATLLSVRLSCMYM